MPQYRGPIDLEFIFFKLTPKKGGTHTDTIKHNNTDDNHIHKEELNK